LIIFTLLLLAVTEFMEHVLFTSFAYLFVFVSARVCVRVRVGAT